MTEKLGQVQEGPIAPDTGSEKAPIFSQLGADVSGWLRGGEPAIEALGRLAGKGVEPVLEFLRNRVESFNVDVSGLENLQALQDQQFLLVANHLKPEGGADQRSQLSPDALVLERIIYKTNAQRLRVVAKADDGWWAENPYYRYVQKYFGQPFGRGMVKSLGFLPVSKNPGIVNRSLVRALRDVIEKGADPILVFPEGQWYEDYDPKHELEPGAATIAQKYDLPILPVYIRGARSWQPNTEVQVSFGKPFEPGELSREEITERIRSSLQNLQDGLADRGGVV